MNRNLNNFLVVLLLGPLNASCSPKDNVEVEVNTEEICFKNFDKAREYLPKPFVNTLLNSDKKQIIIHAQDVGMNPRANKFSSVSPCDIATRNLTVYSISVNINNPDYIGGRLDIYFDSSQLKAAEFFLIELP